jgi:MFS family permease
MGGAFALAGALLLLTVDGDSSVLHLAFPCFVMGIGFGYVASPAVVAAQTAVGWSRRGVATGANMFARSIGSAIGVAVFGAVVNSVVSDRLGHTPPGIEQVSAAVLEPAIHGVFVMTIAFAAVLVVVASLMPTRVTAPEADVVDASDVEASAAS